MISTAYCTVNSTVMMLKLACGRNCMISMIDLHMHIVPSVDDGYGNNEESLRMLRLFEKQGVTNVFLCFSQWL